MKPMSRRKFIKRIFGSLLSLFGISGGTYYYAKHIEPSMLTVNEETISSPKLPSSFTNVKVLQFSDTHLGFHYDIDQFRALVQRIKEEQADLILFTGDLVDAPDQVSNRILEQAANLLQTIEAPLGKYWIYGNHDHGGYGTEKIASVMKLGGFTLLQNQHATIQKDGDSIVLAGLDDAMLGKPNIEETLKGSSSELFTLLMCHEPDYATKVSPYPVDVQLSGHSHGGQIQIPFFGYLITPPMAQKFVEGWHEIGSTPLSLYISRGIGTTRLPYRFLCKPEFTIHTLKSPHS
ncbi:metallophosphoesterase [Pontibacillus marinus]|uniref:Metallophosphoesterase n=2 Tax=Pontibacillus TaxID=289201 RepID=A0A0A5FUR7_9BACI|nr:metallophosphoesterase [Pontibacillus marinus]KGX83644.1 metallophosphoesterase [Pontibacillus marinus BH030004 = DSM 16465]